MGASGCKLRSAEERENHKRARDEEEEEEAENAPVNTATPKKARVEEPTEYQKGVEKWKAILQLGQLKDTLRGLETFSVSVEKLNHSIALVQSNANHVWWPENPKTKDETVFMSILRHAQYHLDDNADRLSKMITSENADVNRLYADGTTPLMVAIGMAADDSPLVNILIERSTPEIINHHNSLTGSVMGILVRRFARCKPETMVKILRKLHAHGADLDWQDRDGQTPLHWIVSSAATSCMYLLMEEDLRWFDWQIRDSNNETVMQMAKNNALQNIPRTVYDSGWQEVSLTEKNAMYRLMQDWDNRWRSVTRAALVEHLLPDLTNLALQYLDGTGEPFRSREEEEEIAKEHSELQAIVDAPYPL